MSEREMGAAPADRRLLAIFLVVLIDVLGLTIILPSLPFYSERYGASPTTVGLLVSAYALCQFVAGPILGHWSDRIGRKPVLILSQIGTFVGFGILAAAPSLFWIFVSRIVDGLTAGNLSTAQAYISDVAPPQGRAKALGRIGIAFSVGFFVGPALTALVSGLGVRAPIYVAMGFSFASILASSLLLPNGEKRSAPAHARESALAVLRRVLAQRGLPRLLLEAFLFYFSFSAYIAGFALFAERRFRVDGAPMNAAQVGYAFAYFGLLGIVTQLLLIGPLVERLGERRTVLLGFASTFVGYGLLALAHGPLWVGVTGIFTSLGSGVLRPVLLSEVAGAVAPKDRGSAIGANQSIQSVAQIVAPLAGTALIGARLLPEWALLPAALSALGAVLALRTVERKPERA